MGAAGSGHHIAGVLLVTRRIANDELARRRGEVAVGHVDGNALLALGRQPIGEQGQVDFIPVFAASGHVGQLVLHHRFAVHQQTANQGAFAIVHRATSDELERRLGVELATSPRGVCVGSY